VPGSVWRSGTSGPSGSEGDGRRRRGPATPAAPSCSEKRAERQRLRRAQGAASLLSRHTCAENQYFCQGQALLPPVWWSLGGRRSFIPMPFPLPPRTTPAPTAGVVSVRRRIEGSTHDLPRRAPRAVPATIPLRAGLIECRGPRAARRTDHPTGCGEGKDNAVGTSHPHGAFMPRPCCLATLADGATPGKVASAGDTTYNRLYVQASRVDLRSPVSLPPHVNICSHCRSVAGRHSAGVVPTGEAARLRATVRPEKMPAAVLRQCAHRARHPSDRGHCRRGLIRTRGAAAVAGSIRVWAAPRCYEHP
jgi:hypothetical protein